MTDLETNRILLDKMKRNGAVSRSPRYLRKKKLQRYFSGRIDAETARTVEKLELLVEIREGR